MGGRKIEFCDADSHPYQFVLRVGEPLQALGGDRTCMLGR
jgi:hypothetical protein